MSLDSIYRGQVQVSVYCAWRIPAHLRCTQCSILLHLMDICFLTCICLWQISQIHTCLCVFVGPGFVLASPAFMRSTPAIHRVRMAGLPKKTVNQFVTAVTAMPSPPLVDCVVWSHLVLIVHAASRQVHPIAQHFKAGQTHFFKRNPSSILVAILNILGEIQQLVSVILFSIILSSSLYI